MKVLHGTEGKCGYRMKVQHASKGEITPPRSLGRCAPDVRLRRALPAHRSRDKQAALKSEEAGKRMRRCRFFIGSAPLPEFINRHFFSASVGA